MFKYLILTAFRVNFPASSILLYVHQSPNLLTQIWPPTIMSYKFENFGMANYVASKGVPGGKRNECETWRAGFRSEGTLGDVFSSA